MKIAIVGACGRLGAAVCEILQKKHEIFKIDLKKSELLLKNYLLPY